MSSQPESVSVSGVFLGERQTSSARNREDNQTTVYGTYKHLGATLNANSKCNGLGMIVGCVYIYE